MSCNSQYSYRLQIPQIRIADSYCYKRENSGQTASDKVMLFIFQVVAANELTKFPDGRKRSSVSFPQTIL